MSDVHPSNAPPPDAPTPDLDHAGARRVALFQAEQRVKLWGRVWLLLGGMLGGGMLLTVAAGGVGALLFSEDLDREFIGGMATFSVLAAWYTLVAVTGYGLVRCAPWAAIPSLIVGVGALVLGPCGLAGIVPLIAVASRGGRAVLTPEYAAVVAATRHLEPELRARYGIQPATLASAVVVTTVALAIALVVLVAALGAPDGNLLLRATEQLFAPVPVNM